jgi:hypothetical protein
VLSPLHRGIKKTEQAQQTEQRHVQFKRKGTNLDCSSGTAVQHNLLGAFCLKKVTKSVCHTTASNLRKDVYIEHKPTLIIFSQTHLGASRTYFCCPVQCRIRGQQRARIQQPLNQASSAHELTQCTTIGRRDAPPRSLPTKQSFGNQGQ